MGRRVPYFKEKRPDTLPEWKEQNLVFDLINAFVLARNPTMVALLLRDLLTTKEVKNLAKRLQIAKMLMKGEKYTDIADELHCSLGTVSKVKIWVEQGGHGFQRILLLLPKRKSKPGRIGGIPGYRLPQILLASAQELSYRKEEKFLKGFLGKVAEKGILDKNIREQLTEEYKEKRLKHKRKISK